VKILTNSELLMSINIISFSLIFFNLWIVLTIISCSAIDENQIPPSS
ncbi:uncharacterized protein METZ01_LOCUS309167, partial [marine metagenome]